MQTKQTCCCCCCSHIWAVNHHFCKHVELNVTVYNIFQYFNVNSRKHKSSLEVLNGPSNNDWNHFQRLLRNGISTFVSDSSQSGGFRLRLVGPKSQWCHAVLVTVSCFLISYWLMFGMFFKTTGSPLVSTGDSREGKLRECAP